MGKFIDKTGQKFNMLTVIKYLGNSKWECLCDCGNKTIVHSSHLNEDPKRLKVRSCGCLLEKNIPEKLDFFEKIDSSEKAYILGFIAADGCIQPELNRVKIDLKEDDEDILLKIQKIIGHKNSLSHYSQNTIIKDKQYISHTSRLVITSFQWVEDLEKYGVTKNKSNTLHIQKNLIPKEFWKDFLRGIIDGDGCISYSPTSKQKCVNLTITTSTINALVLKEMILELTGEDKFYLLHRNKNNLENATLQATNKKYIAKMLKIVYGNSTIYLNRKYQKFQEVIAFIDSQTVTTNCT